MKIQYPKYYQDVTILQASFYQSAKTDIEKIAAFGNDVKVLRKIKASEVAGIVEYLDDMMADTQMATLPTGRFKHGGIEYGIYPNFHELEYGAFLDVVEYCSDDESYWKNANMIASALFREVTIDAGKYYKVKTYDEAMSNSKLFAEQFNDLPVIYLNAAAFFLTSLGRKLESNTDSSILMMARKEIGKARSLLKSTVRFPRFTTWLKETRLKWMK